MIIEINSTWKELLALGYNANHIDKALALVKGAPFVVTLSTLQWLLDSFTKDDININRYISKSARKVYADTVQISYVPRRKNK